MKKNINLFVRYFSWILSIAIMVLIFISSDQTAEISSNTSRGFTIFILSAFYNKFSDMTFIEQEMLIKSLRVIVRKSAHFFIYFMLGASLYSAFNTYNIKTVSKAIPSLTISIIYAASDEWHQTFTAGRAGKITDVLIDTVGAAVGILFVLLICSIYKKCKKGSRTMRKRELLNRLEGLVTTVEKLSKELSELRLENNELKEKLEAQRKEPVTDESLGSADTCNDNTSDETELLNVIEEDEPMLLNESLELGASVIGKITVESAKYCDIITSKGMGNSKELLSLIMGKSELCKNEILNISMSELSTEVKNEMINAQFTEAVDYFISLTEQNN